VLFRSLDPVGGGVGPSLKIGSAAVVAGTLGGWNPIGAEATASGYDVAWKLSGADNYIIWATDNNGNYTASPAGGIAGASATIESFEPGFHQDLNGDGVIGIPKTVIESFGSTELDLSGTTYYLDPVGGGVGPSLKIGGAAVVAGTLGGWNPIGAEATASGYEIAWKLSGADNYIVWTTDNNGNYTTSPAGGITGASATLESFEPGFHQDLNGDGVIGIHDFW